MIKPFLQGNLLLLVCCAFYLAWWLIAFKPVGAVKGVKSGWLLIPAAVAGLLAVARIVGGIRDVPMEGTAVSNRTICIAGIAVYFLLLAGTWLFLKRPVTTELALIVGWTAMVAAEANTLYAARVFGRGQAAAVVASSMAMAVASIECYLAYYKLDAVKGYWDGAIPLALVAVMTAVMMAMMR